MRPLKAGIAGSGFGRNVLLPIFSSRPDVVISAYTGTRIDGLAAEPFQDVRNLIERAGIDFLILALPPLVQQEVLEIAIDRGLHLFCEKPFALDYEIARRVVSLAKSKRLVGAIDFEFRKIPVFASLIEEIRKMGRAERAEISWKVSLPPKNLPHEHWKNRVDLGGGTMSSFGCHLVDLCSAAFGELEVLAYRALRDGSSSHLLAEDEFILEMRGPRVSRLELTVATKAEKNEGFCASIKGLDYELKTVHRNPFNFFGGMDLIRSSINKEDEYLSRASENDDPEMRSKSVARVVDEFLAAIRDGGSLESGWDEALENTRLVAAARQRVATGSPEK
jgi:predicted dehydrogenase